MQADDLLKTASLFVKKLFFNNFFNCGGLLLLKVIVGVQGRLRIFLRVLGSVAVCLILLLSTIPLQMFGITDTNHKKFTEQIENIRFISGVLLCLMTDQFISDLESPFLSLKQKRNSNDYEATY